MVEVGEVRAMLGRAPAHDPGPAFTARVLEAARGQGLARPRPKLRAWWRAVPRPALPFPAWAVSFAAHVLLFGALTVYFYQRSSPPGARQPDVGRHLPAADTTPALGTAGPPILSAEARHARATAIAWLHAVKKPDGSFGSLRETALASMALDDSAAREWLRAHDPNDAVDAALWILACGPEERAARVLLEAQTERGDWVGPDGSMLDLAWAPFLVAAVRTLPDAGDALRRAIRAYNIAPDLQPRGRREVWNGGEGPVALGYLAAIAAGGARPDPAWRGHVTSPAEPDAFAAYHLSRARLEFGSWIPMNWPDALARSQNPDGSWDGNVIATALAVLALQPR
jgi:hypothetical protein